jgi:hypothetical protein
MSVRARARRDRAAGAGTRASCSARACRGFPIPRASCRHRAVPAADRARAVDLGSSPSIVFCMGPHDRGRLPSRDRLRVVRRDIAHSPLAGFNEGWRKEERTFRGNFPVAPGDRARERDAKNDSVCSSLQMSYINRWWCHWCLNFVGFLLNRTSIIPLLVSYTGDQAGDGQCGRPTLSGLSASTKRPMRFSACDQREGTELQRPPEQVIHDA